MKRRLVLGLACLAVAAATLLGGRPAPAFADIEVRSQPAVQNLFPDGARLTIFLASGAEITSVRLSYRILPAGSPSGLRAQCSAGGAGSVINCTADLNRNVVYMAPGAEVEYTWEVEDAAGGKLTTARSGFTYEDERFTWEAFSDGNITVHYYLANEQTAQSVLRVASETMNRFNALEGTVVDFPVKVWVYQTAADLQAAASGRRSDGVHTLGQRVADDTVLVSRDTDFLNIVRHEVAHVVTERATRGQIGVIPTWIDEGLSTYAQTRLIPGEQQAFDLAVRANRMLPITSLNASTRDAAATVSLFYAQSGSIVEFLVETYGEARFAQFVAAFRNEAVDGALKAAYGFDLLGLEEQWRKSLGLPPVSNPPSRQPTRAPSGNGQANDQASSTEDSGGSSSILLIVAAVAGGALVVGAGGYFFWSSRPKNGA